MPAGLLWGALYWAYGARAAAAIPVAYAVLTVLDLLVLFRLRRYELFRWTQQALDTRASRRASARPRGDRRIRPGDPLGVHRGGDGAPVRGCPGVPRGGSRRTWRRSSLPPGCNPGWPSTTPLPPRLVLAFFVLNIVAVSATVVRRAAFLRDGSAQAPAARGGLPEPGADASPVGEARDPGHARGWHRPRAQQPRGRDPARRRAAPRGLEPPRGGQPAPAHAPADGRGAGGPPVASAAGARASRGAERSRRARARGPRGRRGEMARGAGRVRNPGVIAPSLADQGLDPAALSRLAAVLAGRGASRRARVGGSAVRRLHPACTRSARARRGSPRSWAP